METVKVYAILLSADAQKKGRWIEQDAFRGTYNPDWTFSATDKALWIYSAYGYTYSEQFQIEHLRHALNCYGLKEDIDYKFETK